VRDDIYGEAPAIIKHMMEIRGLGIIDVKAVYGVGAVKKRKRLELVIGLENWAPEKEYRRVGNPNLNEMILDIPIPKYIIPIMPGRNIAILIEVAVRDFRLKQEGYDTLSEIEKRMEDGHR
jgi:HPr kinase/phosphorylase